MLELLQKRRSCRNFQDKAVEAEKKEKLLQAAQLAPTGRNTHSWEFVVVEEKVNPLAAWQLPESESAVFAPNTSCDCSVGRSPENRYLGRRCCNCLHCDTVGSGVFRTWFLLGCRFG